MKTTWIKALFILALLGSGSAITLAAKGHSHFDEMTPVSVSHPAKIQESADKKFYHWIRQQIGLPDFIQDQNERNRVVLHLEMDAFGNIMVTNIEGENSHLKEYVVDQLQGLKCPDDIPAKSYHFAIRFYRIN